MNVLENQAHQAARCLEHVSHNQNVQEKVVLVMAIVQLDLEFVAQSRKTSK